MSTREYNRALEKRLRQVYEQETGVTDATVTPDEMYRALAHTVPPLPEENLPRHLGAFTRFSVALSDGMLRLGIILLVPLIAFSIYGLVAGDAVSFGMRLMWTIANAFVSLCLIGFGMIRAWIALQALRHGNLVWAVVLKIKRVPKEANIGLGNYIVDCVYDAAGRLKYESTFEDNVDKLSDPLQLMLAGGPLTKFANQVAAGVSFDRHGQMHVDLRTSLWMVITASALIPSAILLSVLLFTGIA